MSYFVMHATPELVYAVSKNMRARELEELLAVRWENDREELAMGLAETYGNLPMTICLGKDNVPICILSAVAIHPGVWSMGMWATDDFQSIGKFVTRFSVKTLFPALQGAKLHRLECKSIVGYSEIHEWLHYLGFLEGNVEKMYGKNGEDFVTFYWHDGMPIRKRVKTSA